MEQDDNSDEVADGFCALCVRFYTLYAEVFPEPLAREEFEADDLYAFQTFERALHSENEELRELAAQLQQQRQVGLETIELDGAEQFGSRRPKIDFNKGASPARATPAVPPLQAQTAAEAAPAPEAPVKSESPAAPPQESAKPAAVRPAAVPPAERRAGAARMSPEELEVASWLRRLYQREFGEPMDIPRFKLDDEYGRQVLQESMAAGDPELVELAQRYLDPTGAPRAHRRRSPR